LKYTSLKLQKDVGSWLDTRLCYLVNINTKLHPRANC